jgi:TonB family protein
MSNSNGQGFIALLGQQVLGKQNLTLSNHFSKSQTVKRIKMIKSGKKKPAVLRWTVMVAAVLTMFYFFSCEQGYTFNELVAQNEDLPNLGDGWSYVSDESLPPAMSDKLEELKSGYPSVEFHVAKATSGTVPFPDIYSNPEIREKYAFKIWFDKEGESYFVILGKSEKEFTDITAHKTSELEMIGEEIFTVVDDQPEPVGGMQAYYEYVAKNLSYPEEARKLGIEGRVFIEFIVSKDGSITNVKCIKGIGDLCDSEAVRVISNSPAWIPGKQKGGNVNVRMILPITFKLGNSEEKK